jgi:hypothetical protein
MTGVLFPLSARHLAKPKGGISARSIKWLLFAVFWPYLAYLARAIFGFCLLLECAPLPPTHTMCKGLSFPISKDYRTP